MSPPRAMAPGFITCTVDLLMCLYKRVFEFGPDSGAPCPISVHMDCRLTRLHQTEGEVTATFSNGRTASAEVLVGADGINSATLQLAWASPRPKRWTEVTCFRGLIPRTVVASLRKADGSPLDHNPIDLLQHGSPSQRQERGDDVLGARRRVVERVDRPL